MSRNYLTTTQSELTELYSKYSVEHIPCKICKLAIWYPHTKYKITIFNKLNVLNGNWLTNKKINVNTYNLKICYTCLITNQPDASTKISSKLFNTCNNYVKVAFEVTDDDYNKQRKLHGVTLTSLINKYGKVEGTIKWENYLSLQKITNTFEYKQKTHNWTLEEFNEFNKARGITLDNLQLKYGTDLGLIKYTEYCDKQRYTKSLQYYLDKFGNSDGPIKWKAVNKSKARTLSNYINSHGEKIGTEKYNQYINSIRLGCSKISQEIFSKLDLKLKDFNLSTFYSTKNYEYSFILSKLKKSAHVDFFIKELNIAIEFNGIYWHASPLYYSDDSIIYLRKMKASDIWEHDKQRCDELRNSHGLDVIIIWENEYINNKNKIINDLYEYIKSKI